MKVLNLTGPDGVPDYQLPPGLKEALCLLRTDDGTLELRVSGHLIHSPEVMDYEYRLRQTKPEYVLKTGGFAEIAELNKQADTRVHDDQSKIQSTVVEIMRAAVALRASDVHVRLGSQYCDVFFRIDGKLRFFKDLPADKGQSYINALYNTMCEDRSHPSISYSEPSDAKVREEFVRSLGLSGGRFASRPCDDHGLLVVIRLISRRNERLSMAQLGLSATETATLERAMTKPTGVIFLTGPMGSGKSTLAQVICEQLTSRDEGIHLLTVENPVESPIRGAVQTSLGPGEEWWEAIKSMMRLDLNWILIGEVRDARSASAAIEAAQTGHNVLTTLHTTHPVDTIARLKSLRVDSDLITDASLITCLVGQRLAPLLCHDCKIPYREHKNRVSPLLNPLIEKHCDVQQVCLKNSEGCARCSGSGVKGRTGVFEVIEVDATFMELYHSAGKIKAYEYWYINGGMTLCANTLRLINAGETDPVLSHKDICNLDRDHLMFTPEVREAARNNRLTS